MGYLDAAHVAALEHKITFARPRSKRKKNLLENLGNKSPARILVVLKKLSANTDASQRTNGITEFLKRHFDVYFFSIYDELDEKDSRTSKPMQMLSLTPEWAQRLSGVHHQTLDSSLAERIRDIQPALIIFSSQDIFPLLLKRTSIPCILDAYDLNWVMEKRKYSIAFPGLKGNLKGKIRAGWNIFNQWCDGK